MHADYHEIQDTLPFYGGATAVELSAAVQTAGFPEPSVESLMDPALWGGPVDRERYALHAIKR
jgi:hypothetical protein